MYPGCLVVGEASLTGLEISPNPPLIFIRGQKVRNLAAFLTCLDFEPPAFENAARYLNAETNLVSDDDRSCLLQG